MLNSLSIENFKCFEHLIINLKNLNVFSGLNGMGKSTTIQALLMLRQSLQQGYLPQHVCLNGDFVSLGTGKDILYEYAANDNITIQLTELGKVARFELSSDPVADVLNVVNSTNTDINALSGPFEYLNAERMAPQSIYPKSSYFVNVKSQLGVNGQYSAHYLYNNQDREILWDSCYGRERFLKGAVQYWLSEVSPNVKLDIQDIKDTDLSKIGYYYTDNEKSNIYRPTNVGFGISYVLPIILAIIKAVPNSLLILENPEAHLHPKGQRKIGELIALCASNNIQIIVETHSDHILNGIRIAVKKHQISNTDVGLNFFSKKISGGKMTHIIENPTIQNTGKLDYWPDGFFDEWEKALDEIL